MEDRLDDAMESEDDDMDGVHDEEDEDEIDPDDGKPVKLGGSDYLDWKEHVSIRKHNQFVSEGKVEPVSLGTGMCRGPVWQRGVWPIAKGFKSKKGCAEACARTKNCMGFDLSGETDKEKFKCFLYGDRRLSPASGVPGECFTLRDRLDDLRHEDVDEDFFEDHKDDGKELKFGEC